VRIAVVGGGGFVGSNLAVELATRGGHSVVAFDNLKRRGSELTLPRLRAAGVEFLHGDVRHTGDLAALPPVDALVECSAEPSVLAGIDGGLDYLVETNLVGAYNCLELCRMRGMSMVFLSTSRVYPVAALNSVALEERETRLVLAADQKVNGASPAGISEAFPLDGARTPYGATKLAAEMLLIEYVESFGLQAVVNRCGVLAGPWQMGKVDQGILSFWLLAHHFGRPVSYLGYGGTGKQVRDFLHVSDLARLVAEQLEDIARWTGHIVNVGGGAERSLSLVELTALCRHVTGREVPVGSEDATRPGDIPIYISDCARLFELTGWRPEISVEALAEETYAWVCENEATVASALGL
jgi:CDP-paratose 2-epimerase